ncbi:uncharacterized protein J5M81_008932 isoform 1-T1 [Pluvialis apricaria]
MVPMRHLHLILLLMVALHARTAWTAPWQAREADDGGSNDDAASWLDVGLEPSGHPGDPLKVDSSPTSSPVPVLKPASNLTAVPVDEGDAASRLGSSSEAPGGGMVTDVPVGKTFPAPQLDPVLESGWHHRETDQEAMKKEVFPEGRSNSVPVRAEETKAMQATGVLGDCCPVVSQCHLSYQDHYVSADFPQCSLLPVMSAAKAERVLGLKHLDRILQMMGNVTLAQMSLPL